MKDQRDLGVPTEIRLTVLLHNFMGAECSPKHTSWSIGCTSWRSSLPQTSENRTHAVGNEDPHLLGTCFTLCLDLLMVSHNPMTEIIPKGLALKQQLEGNTRRFRSKREQITNGLFQRAPSVLDVIQNTLVYAFSSGGWMEVLKFWSATQSSGIGCLRLVCALSQQRRNFEIKRSDVRCMVRRFISHFGRGGSKVGCALLVQTHVRGCQRQQ